MLRIQSVALVSLLVAITSPVLAQSTEPACELWQFSSDGCGACRLMEPVVATLEQQGVPIRKIDANQQPQLAAQADIQALPTFLVVANGQIIDRAIGVQSAEQLTSLLRSGVQATEAATASANSNRPDHLTQSQAAHDCSDGSCAASSGPSRLAPPASIAAGMDRPTVATAQQATVRLRIEDPSGVSFGTGTVVDVHEDEVLVLTCAHIFTASQGRGDIYCDFFTPGAGTKVRGKLISHDKRRDIGLLSVRVQSTVTPVQVGGTGNRPRSGDAVFTIGCNRGDDPTVETNQVLAVNRYHGPANLVVGGRPVDGRSGGGLFASDGTLIGVCNAADQERDEGLYASLGPIHTELDAAGLGFIYRQSQPALASRANEAPAELGAANGQLYQPPTAPATERLSSEPIDSRDGSSGNYSAAKSNRQLATRSPANSVSSSQLDASEVICIVRPRDVADGMSQAYVLDRPSPALMQQLSAELDRRGPHQLTESRSEHPITARGEGDWRSAK